MKSIRLNAKSIPVAFAIVTLLAYGLLLPLTGFYWDDWPFAWIARFLGPSEFIPAFLGFRPFLGPIFFITTSLIPPNPILWQVFALLIHFLAALCAWFALNGIWPNQRRQTLIASLLFLVFPGYSQHWVAFTHINQEWIPFILYLLSFGFTARLLRDPQKFLPNTIYALLLLVVGIFPTEYFIGLEPFRFMFIWVIVSEGVKGFRPRLVQVIKYWWPYFTVWIANLLWLFYYYKSGAYISYDLTAAPGTPALSEALFAFGDALWKAGLYVWVQVLVLAGKSITAPTTLITLALVAVTFILSSFYFFRLDLSQGERRTFASAAIPIGLIAILFGRVPSFLAGLPLTLQSSYDRFMISMMLGGSLFITGLVELSIRNQRAKTAVFALLIALGIGQQFFNANIFRRDWQGQQEIYWEFAWRIPALQPNTAVITQQMPLDYETDLSMTAPLNWMYAAQIRPPDLPYALIYSEKRLGGSVLPDLKPGTAIQLPYRTATFHGDTSQVIAIYVPKNGCLRVFDPAFDDAETYAKFPESLIASIPLSDPSRIITDAPPPSLPSPPFIKEPPHTWCYYYEKAELARQTRDWNRVAELGREASAQDFTPQDAFEWLPFIEAYARSGDLNLAGEITRRAWDEDAKVHRGLCALWKRVQADGADEAQSAALSASKGFASDLLTKLGCGH